MNEVKLLERLYDLQKNIAMQLQDKNTNDEITSIINDLKTDISLEKVNNPSRKKAIKKAISFMKKIKSHNVGLKKTYILNLSSENDEEYQVFTDSYTAFYIKERYEMPNIVEEKETVGFADSLASMYSSLNEMKETSTLKIDYKKICAILKTEKTIFKNLDMNAVIVKISNGEKEKYFDANKLKTLFDILGTQELIFNTNFDGNAFLLAKDEETKNKAILCPIRVAKDVPYYNSIQNVGY